jgi:hypothetical protein
MTTNKLPRRASPMARDEEKIPAISQYPLLRIFGAQKIRG